MPTSAKQSVLADLKQALTREGYSLEEYFRAKPSGFESQGQFSREDVFLLDFLTRFKGEDQLEGITELLAGERIVLEGYYAIGELQDRALVVTLEPSLSPQERQSYPSPMYVCRYKLQQLLRRRPFPFGVCEVCKRVFTQLERGQPRKYCSQTCAAKGIPSRKNRTTYIRDYRHRNREREIEKTARILRRWPDEKQYLPRLQKEFPKKSRRQLLYLVKCASQQAKEKKEEQLMPRFKHGSGSVYKRGKTWWITYYVDGKQVWESAKTKDRAEARRILQ